MCVAFEPPIPSEPAVDPMLLTAAKNAMGCLSVDGGDRVLVITDTNTQPVGQALESAASKITVDGTGQTIKVILERYGDRPFGKLPPNLQRLINDLNPTVSIYAAQAQEGELGSFRQPLIYMLTKKGTCRHGHMPGISTAAMKAYAQANLEQVETLTYKLAELLQSTTKIKLADIYGTNITAKFDPDTGRWVPDAGNITAQSWNNIPSGEIFTCPMDIEGSMAVWCLGDHFDKKYGVLAEPLRVVLAGGYVTDVIYTGSDSISLAAAQELRDYLQLDTPKSESARIGEFGIGTMVGLDRLFGEMLIDEKGTTHIAAGYPYPDETGAQWGANCKTHIDMLVLNDSLELVQKDGTVIKIKENGAFLEF